MKFTKVIAAAACIVALPAAAQDKADWPTSLTIGTGSQGGAYFGYGSGFGAMISEALGVNAGVEITGGPVQNVTLVETGEHQLGFVTLGPADEARRGESPLMPGVPHESVRALFPMYQTPFSVTVLSSSGITTIADIPAGSKIGFGPAGSTSDTYFPAMMETLGVDFDRRNGSWSDLGGQLQDGLIDDHLNLASGEPGVIGLNHISRIIH